MNIENKKHRLELLQKKHDLQHSMVEALEAEKAPEKTINRAKQEKLALKDEITTLKKELGDNL
jgi:hypothetical protein